MTLKSRGIEDVEDGKDAGAAPVGEKVERDLGSRQALRVQQLAAREGDGQECPSYGATLKSR